MIKSKSKTKSGTQRIWSAAAELSYSHIVAQSDLCLCHGRFVFECGDDGISVDAGMEKVSGEVA